MEREIREAIEVNAVGNTLQQLRLAKDNKLLSCRLYGRITRPTLLVLSFYACEQFLEY